MAHWEGVLLGTLRIRQGVGVVTRVRKIAVSDDVMSKYRDHGISCGAGHVILHGVFGGSGSITVCEGVMDTRKRDVYSTEIWVSVDDGVRIREVIRTWLRSFAI